MANEAFARVNIDQLLKNADWTLTDARSVRFEYPPDDSGKTDYTLFDRQGRALTMLEAKSTSVDLTAREALSQRYADQFGRYLRVTRSANILSVAVPDFVHNHHHFVHYRNRHLGVTMVVGRLQPLCHQCEVTTAALQHDRRHPVGRVQHVGVTRLVDTALKVKDRARLSAPRRQIGYRVNGGDSHEAASARQRQGKHIRATASASNESLLLRCWSIAAHWLCQLLCIAPMAIFFSQTASAETSVHLSRPVWGCVDPNEATPLNDNSNPARSDPQWVARTAQFGQCITLGTVGQWAALSENYNGLTYIGHRGNVGPIGSFWVPTTALVIDAKPSVSVVAAPKPVARPPASEPPIIIAKRTTESAQPPQPTAPATPPVAVAPEDTTIAPTASSTASPQGSGGGSAIWVTLGVLVVGGLFWRSKRRKKSRQRPSRKTKITQPARTPTDIDFRIHSSSLSASPKPAVLDQSQAVVSRSDFQVRIESTLPKSGTVAVLPSNSQSKWHPPGTSVTIAGHTVTDGMLYVGKASRKSGQHDGCVIDPKLPVGGSTAAEPLGYWPSYENMSPNCRKRYLEWLEGGKQAADIDIGYVFLYFYGLERRLILETPPVTEVEALSQELQRLRSLYSGNGSFNGYSARLLEAVAFLREAGNRSGNPFISELVESGGEIPPALKLAIAREVMSGRPLGFDLAAAAVTGMREFRARYRQVLDHARQPFLQVLKTRFTKAFPSGFLVRNRKDSRLVVSYRGATAGLYLDLAVQAGLKGLPDPETLTWTKLLNLAEAVADELTPLTKLIAYYPTRANSLTALVDCPVELRDSIAVDARRWIDGLTSPSPVPFGLLVKHAIGTEGAKWTVRHRRQVGEALAVIGWSMEPGADDAIERLADDTIVFVIRALTDGQSREMTVASAAAMLVANIAKANKDHGTRLEEFWLSQLPSRLALPASDTERLRARLAWYRNSNVAIPKVKRLLGDATPEQCELCAWSATVATGATGNFSKPQIAALEAIYDALGVARSTLYTGLHAGVAAAANGIDEPVEVSGEVAEATHRIPPPPATKPAGPDVDRLAKIRAETESVSAMLASIFTEAEPQPEEARAASDCPLVGLDNEQATLLTKLVTRSEWTRQEFEALAVSLNLMPDGALEAINEWAFDRYGDALVEDGDALILNLDLLAQDLPTITADELK